MKKKPKNKKNKNLNLIIAILLILTIALSALAIYMLVQKPNDKEEKAYTELLRDIEEGAVEEIEMTVGSTTLKVTYKERENEDDKEKIIIPNTQAFVEYIHQKRAEGIEVKLNEVPSSFIVGLRSNLLSIISTALMITIVVMIFKMQGLGDKGKIYDGVENKSDVTFDDVAGLQEEKQEMIEIVDFLKEPERFVKMGAKIPKGILLCGKPGTGKTLIARAIAGEANVPFISMSGSEFIEMFAGLGASRVRKLFEKARKLAPCIIFIDEIDAIGSRRTSNSGAESENNQTLNQLLVEMDGFEKNDTIIVLAATNRPEMLDKALLRPGRFDRQITIAPPDVRGREEILKIYSKEKKLSENVDLKRIAEDTAGFTGAELSNIMNEAAIIGTIRRHEEITTEDIEDAIKKVTVGLQKSSRIISDKDKKLTAYHEAGHAIVGKYLETILDVKEISIIPRGVAGGYTMYKSDEDKFYISKTEIEEKLVSLLGGRAAEKLALDDISTGAANDLEVATKTARDMIILYGMSDAIGPISLQVDDVRELEFYGTEIEDEVGKEIRRLIYEAYERAIQILTANRDKLDAVAEALIKKETITEEEFNAFFEW